MYVGGGPSCRSATTDASFVDAFCWHFSDVSQLCFFLSPPPPSGFSVTVTGAITTRINCKWWQKSDAIPAEVDGQFSGWKERRICGTTVSQWIWRRHNFHACTFIFFVQSRLERPVGATWQPWGVARVVLLHPLLPTCCKMFDVGRAPECHSPLGHLVSAWLLPLRVWLYNVTQRATPIGEMSGRVCPVSTHLQPFKRNNLKAKASMKLKDSDSKECSSGYP